MRGTVRGPFRYCGTSPQSKRYCTIEDAAGNVWDKAFHDVIPYDNSRMVASYKIAEFPLPTKEAIDLERSWKVRAPKAVATPSARSRKSKEHPDDDEDYDGLP